MTVRDDFKSLEELGILKLACENSLKAYIKVMHHYNVGNPFTFKHFHNSIILHLENRVNYKTTKNLLINMPVGFGKTALIEYFISWCFAKNKNYTFLYTSYSDDLVTKHSSEIMEQMKSETYSTFWQYDFKKSKQSKSNWSIEGSTGRSGLTAGAMGGTITGLDAGNPAIEGFCGAMIIDDPLKATDIIFETKRQDCIYKYNSALKTRLRRSDVPIILIMQRLQEDDLSGWILENEPDKWDVIKIRALEDEKSIWEEKVSTAELLDKRDKTPFVFYPQYQQEPNSNINSSFKGLNFAEKEEEKNIFNGFSHTDKGFDGSDGTAFTIINKAGDTYYVFGKLWQEKHVDDCLTEMSFFRQKYMSGMNYTEKNDDKGYMGRNFPNTSTYQETQNKHFKIMTYLYPAWKNIKFIEGTDEAYIRQIQSYNEHAKHDDAPDSLASAIRLFETRTKVIGMRPF